MQQNAEVGLFTKPSSLMRKVLKHVTLHVTKTATLSINKGGVHGMAVRYRGLEQGAFRQVVWNLGLISLGSAISAVAINGILVPLQFFSGGFAGLALILHYLFPVLPVGFLYFLLNVPLFAVGWQHVGRRFFLYSMAGMVIFSALLKGKEPQRKRVLKGRFSRME